MKHFYRMERFTCLIAIAIFIFNGCSTISHNSKNEVNFGPAPSGAGVYVNGKYTGIAPLELKLESMNDYTIEFQKAGYKNKTVVLKNLSGDGRIVIDVVGLVPINNKIGSGPSHNLGAPSINYSNVK